MSTLAEQIAAFQQALPELRREIGPAWAIFVDNRYKAAFDKFSDAADYAVKSFGDQEFLIRHTDEPVETMPFLLIEP